MKLFSIILKLSYTVLFIPIYFIIKLISPFILIRWAELQTARVGGLNMETSVYCNYRNARKKTKKKNIDIFYPEKKISNKFLFSLCQKKINIFPRFLIKPLNDINRIFVKIFPQLVDHQLDLMSIRYKNRHLINESEKILQLSTNDLDEGFAYLEKMGIPKNKKFVCLMVRDNAYLEKEFPNYDWKYHDYRNSDINNFVPAIEKIIKEEIYVLKMGSVTQTNLDISSKYFIDYSNSNFKDDFMDIFLFSNSYFTITTGTGIDTVSFVSKRPMIYVGIVPLKGYQYSGTQIINLTKDHYNKNTSNLMSLNQIFESEVWKSDKSNFFSKQGVALKDNHSSDILDVVDEMLKRLSNKWIQDKEMEQLQNKFKNIFIQNTKHLFDKNFNITSNYSNNYLMKNKWWLN